MSQFFTVFFLCLFVFQSHAQIKLDHEEPKFVDGRIVVEVNDSGEMVTLSEEEYYQYTGLKFTEQLVGFFNFKMSWETVASYITPSLEDEFDVFIMINVDFEKRQNMDDEIPAQYMKVVQRTAAGQKLFVRKNGQVVGVRADVTGNNGQPAFAETIKALNGKSINGHGVMSNLIPVSSGAGHKANDPQPYVDTPTGIYRIAFNKSDAKRYSKGMYHSLYFDLIYPWSKAGTSSGLAVHGTTEKMYPLLGKKQDSHGCVRVKQNVANLMYENLINDGGFWAEDLPDLNNKLRLKSENGEVKAGPRALIVIFYGYDKKLEQFDI